MKARTEAILRAGSDPMLSNRWGVCDAIHAPGTCGSVYCHAMGWFNDIFRPVPARDAYWLGDLTPENLHVRLTFIAMAACVSETEE